MKIEIKPEILEFGNQKADEIASDLGYDDGQDLVDQVGPKLASADTYTRSNATRAAGTFVSKLSLVLFEQIIYDAIGTASIYNWVNKFNGPTLTYGNSIQFNQTALSTAGTYDKSKWIPDNVTSPFIDTFSGQMYKNDGSLADNAYQYKKSLSLEPKTWMPYFASGKLSEVIGKITAEMNETYTMFVANKLQQIIKTLADGSAQVQTANAGINGKSLKLAKKDSTATDSFSALVELLGHINDLTTDVNNLTIANDSTNIRAVDLDDLVIFIPKKLLAKFRSGVMSRLPSSDQFSYEKIFNSDRVVAVGSELSTVQTNSNQVITTVANATPFLDETKIVVLEKRAIQHCFAVKEHESQYFAENMIQQLTNHMWGFFCVIPFAKGFVFNCPQLLTDPN